MSCTCFMRQMFSPALQRRAYATAVAKTSSLEAVALLKTQPCYVIAQLHQRIYLLTPNDLLTVPRIKGDLQPGDQIRLSRIVEVGSRDYTLKAAPTPKLAERAVLADDEVQVYATVEEHTKSKMQRIEKFKRRHRYHRLLDYKGEWTRQGAGGGADAGVTR
jgi:large subunit ribosomal protein L21